MRKGLAGIIFLISAVSFFEASASGQADQSQASSAALKPYMSCQFSDGLKIVETTPLPPEVTARQVDTDSGPRQIDLQAGVRVMFGYPETGFYANVKAELLPAANYPELKQSLLDNFQHLAQGNTVNTTLRSPLNGLEVHGLDRDKLEGGVLGTYLLFDNTTHVVTTIYMLNQEPESRKFQTIDEYRSLRDRFLASYTGCIQSNLQHQP